MIPDFNSQLTNVELQSNPNITRDRPPYHLDSVKTQHSSRVDGPSWGLRLPTDPSAKIVDPVAHYTHRSEDAPWLVDLSGHHTPPEQLSTQGAPRILKPSLLPPIRESELTEHSQRSLSVWTRSQRSYSTLSPLLPTPGHPHFTTATNYSELPRVKREPDVARLWWNKGMTKREGGQES